VRFAVARRESLATADDFIKGMLDRAQRDLDVFRHQPIIKALRDSPDGVSVSHFKGVEDKGVLLADVKQVAIAMKNQNGIVYHFPSGQYRLATRAHRTALALLESNPQ